jgi:PAS domain S-box-containing protein
VQFAALSHDLMAALDADGAIAWANLAWLRLLGWPPAELRGRTFATVLHPDDVGAVGDLIGGREAALRVRTRSGGERRVAFSTLASPEEGFVYVCGRDASETLELELELRAAEDRFRVVTEATSDAILISDGRGRITFANAGVRTVFGWEPHELLGQPFTILLPERRRAVWASRLEHFLGTGEADLLGRVLELEGVRRDGTEFPMEASLGFWERFGRRAFTGILRDVSERRRTQSQLERSRARYRALVVNLPEVIVALLDPELRLVVMEGGQLARRGLRPDDFEGRPLAETVPPAIYEQFEPVFRAALAGETQHFEYDGESVRYEVRVMPLPGEDGVIGAFAVARDVTALREAQRSLEEHARELERSNAELAEFAYVASHDLSEPLRTIASYLELLRRRHGDSLSAEADEFVSRAVDGAGRMRALIEDLLAYSRTGRSERSLEPVDLGALVASIADTVTGDPPPVIEWDDLPTVTGEPGQLTQLLQNLITNAVKFVAPGTVPHVRVSAERDGTFWRLAVDDNGIGIDPQYAERVFGMFQRLHTRDTFPGTGIGLAIARKVVEHHDGSISAEPRPEGGTRMVFTLPA